jgi:hypothetical protein
LPEIAGKDRPRKPFGFDPGPSARPEPGAGPWGVASVSSSPQSEFRDLTVATLRRAVEIYLAEAYPGVAPPPAVARRLDWPEGVSLAELLGRPPFERVQPPGGEGGPIYALRLGNHRYPHMKLQVQPWPTSTGYMLSVNTHDQILGLDPEAPDAAAFLALQQENQRLKEAIEAAWDRQGFPTFLRYLREYLDAQAGGHSPPGAGRGMPA